MPTRVLATSAMVLALVGCGAVPDEGVQDGFAKAEQQHVDTLDDGAEASLDTALAHDARCDVEALGQTSWELSTNAVQQVAVDRSGRVAAIGPDGVSVVDLASGAQTRVHAASDVHDVAIAAGTVLVGESSGRATLMSAASGEVTGSVAPDNDAVVGVALGGGHAVALSASGSMVVWSPETGDGALVSTGLEEAAVVQIVSGWLAVGGSTDGRAALELYDLADPSGAAATWIADVETAAAATAVTQLIARPGGFVAAGGDDDGGVLVSVGLWGPTPTLQQQPIGHAPTALTAVGSDNFATLAADGAVVVWRASDLVSAVELSLPGALDLAYDPVGGSLLAAGAQGITGLDCGEG